MNTIFGTLAEISFVESKAQRDEGSRRILLGNITGGGAVTLWPISFQCAAVWILMRTLVCIYLRS
jgi:hypothetical protein